MQRALHPCPLHGHVASLGCGWCILARERRLADAGDVLAEQVRALLRETDPSCVVQNLWILGVVGGAAAVIAVTDAELSAEWHRVLLKPDDLLILD